MKILFVAHFFMKCATFFVWHRLMYLDFYTQRFIMNKTDYEWKVWIMEQVIFYIGQALGVVAVILGFINYQVKTREQVLIVHIATTLCFVLHYLCLGAWAGMAMNFVGFVRNLIFYFNGKNGKVSRGLAVCFALIMGAMGVTASLIAKEGWYFVLSVLGLVINSYAMSFSDPNNIRKSILVTSPMVLIYDCFVLSFGGIVYESVVIISSIIGIFRFRKVKMGN